MDIEGHCVVTKKTADGKPGENRIQQEECIAAFFRFYVIGNFRKSRGFNPSKYETIRHFSY